MIKPTIPNNLKQKIYVLDRKCLCGERFTQQISMRWGSVLTFPINIVWFYGHRQETMIEGLTYRCYMCGQDHIAWKPEDVPSTVWMELYIEKCRELGIYDMDKEQAEEWPSITREQAMRLADEQVQRYSTTENEPDWYKAWAANPKTVHHILDRNGKVVADTVTYTPKPDISIHIVEDDFDWKG